MNYYERLLNNKKEYLNSLSIGKGYYADIIREKYNAAEEGEWITVKGNHILVKHGQTKEDAIKEFVEKQKGKKQKVHKAKETKNKEKILSSISDEYKRQAKSLYKEVIAGKNLNILKTIPISKVSEQESKEIQQKTGLDVSGYEHTLSNTEIKHAHRQHGNEKAEAARGQIAISEEDIELIPFIIKNYDSVSLSPDESEGRPVLIYKKRIEEEYVYLTLVLGINKKELRFKDLWKKK